RDDPTDPWQRGVPEPADHRRDRQGDARRSGEMHRGRRIRLPREADRSRAAAHSPSPVALPVARMSRRDIATPDRPTVLIVDDNADKLIALESILLSLDVEIVAARSGREALRQLLERNFAVILLDVRMPGMDGFETTALIRERQRSANTPI